VLESAHGLEALEVAGGHPGPIHLLVTDVIMPHLSGRTLAAELRRQRPALRVLFTSGYPTDVLTEAALQSEVAFIGKPYDPITLARRVRGILTESVVAGLAT
jgi:two-component system, cell cycle sensor histidine kinase and response regulator CckA